MTSEELIRRYAEANERDDFAAMEARRHADWQQRWPQSGEVVPDSPSYRAVRTQRPVGQLRVEPRCMGGSGDCWWAEEIVHYADGSRWLGVSILELRDGLVWRERIYFGPPFPAPEMPGEMDRAGGACSRLTASI